MPLKVTPSMLVWSKALSPQAQAYFKALALEMGLEAHLITEVEKKRELKSSWLVINSFDELKNISKKFSNASVYYISILTLPKKKIIPPFWRSWNKKNNIIILSHTKLLHRYFRILERWNPKTALFLPLPLISWFQLKPKEKEECVVSTFSEFRSQSNLSLFLSVSHYVKQREPSIRFRIYGKGPLLAHVLSQIKELEMDVEVIGTHSNPCEHFDLYLHTSIQEGHMIYLLGAASNKVPVITQKTLGIEQYIQEGREGYVTPINNVTEMGKAVLAFWKEKDTLKNFGEHLYKRVNDEYSLDAFKEFFISNKLKQVA